MADEEKDPETDHRVVVPDFRGQNIAQAQIVLKENGLLPFVFPVHSELKPGTVISSKPVAGTIVDPESSVTLLASDGAGYQKGENDEPEGGIEQEQQAAQDFQEARNRSRVDALKEQVAQKAKQKVVKEGKKMVERQAVRWAGRATVVETAPIWGPILAVVVLFLVLIGFTVTTLVVVNEKCTDSPWIRGISWIASWVIDKDVCKQVTTAFGGGTGGGGGANATFTPNPNQPPPPPTSGSTYTDAEGRASLAAASITVNAAQPRTSLEGIYRSVIDEIIRFKAACGAWTGSPCDVIFTGGTETTGGHAGGPCSHLSGNKADISDTTSVTKFIEATFTTNGTRSGFKAYINPATSVSYVHETAHFDIGGVGC